MVLVMVIIIIIIIIVIIITITLMAVPHGTFLQRIDDELSPAYPPGSFWRILPRHLLLHLILEGTELLGRSIRLVEVGAMVMRPVGRGRGRFQDGEERTFVLPVEVRFVDPFEQHLDGFAHAEHLEGQRIHTRGTLRISHRQENGRRAHFQGIAHHHPAGEG